MNWKALIFTLLLPCWLGAAPTPAGLPFLDMNIREAQLRAAQLNKPVFVYFSASWCMPCQWMEKNPFMDAGLISLVSAHYIAIKVDADDVQGAIDIDQYQVLKFPTMLIFSASGKILARQERSVSTDRLIELLSKYQSAKDAGMAAPAVVGAPEVHMDHLNMPPLVPSPAPRNTYYASSESEEGQSVPSSYTPPVTENTYRTANLDYYVIQTGAFADYQGAMQSRREAEQRYRVPVSILEDSQPQRATLFKVHVGHFFSATEAENFLKQLKTAGVQGFVVKRSKL